MEQAPGFEPGVCFLGKKFAETCGIFRKAMVE